MANSEPEGFSADVTLGLLPYFYPNDKFLKVDGPASPAAAVCQAASACCVGGWS